jgi:hypothetical protein
MTNLTKQQVLKLLDAAYALEDSDGLTVYYHRSFLDSEDNPTMVRLFDDPIIWYSLEGAALDGDVLKLKDFDANHHESFTVLMKNTEEELKRIIE